MPILFLNLLLGSEQPGNSEQLSWDQKVHYRQVWLYISSWLFSVYALSAFSISKWSKL